MQLANLAVLLFLFVQRSISYVPLSDQTLTTLPPPGDDFDIRNGRILAPILQPRVPGTPGSDAVLSHLANFFTKNLPQWKLSFQNSTQVTPLSKGAGVPFRNLIATRDPPWVERDGEVGRLALVAHYDSLSTPAGFIGATDSAAPCAMLLYAAQSIDAALTKKWESMASSGADDVLMEEHKGIQILLLDGEEAFKHWSATDSLYGARALAEEWDQTAYPAMSTYSNPLASIDLFVLLDLLGAKGSTVPSYFKTTHWAYMLMADLETRLRKVGMFKSSPDYPSKAAFLNEAGKTDNDRWIGGYVEDDHIPFQARGVEILHLIAHPFPPVWHNIDDDGEHLDLDSVEDWATLTAAFAAEWMELEGYFDLSRVKRDSTRQANTEKSELVQTYG